MKVKRILGLFVLLALAVTAAAAPISRAEGDPAVVIDGELDASYTENGFAFEMYPIAKDGWHNTMSDHVANTANVSASGYYTFDSEWVYVYTQCEQPGTWAMGCAVHANAKPSTANYQDGAINPDAPAVGDYKSAATAFQRMNIQNLETALTSEADTVFTDSIWDNKTEWFGTWFRNAQNDREGVAVKRTADNKSYAVEFKFKRDANEKSAMFSVSYRFAGASGYNYLMATGGADMYNYSGMIRVYFNESKNAPIKIDGVRDAAYEEGNCAEFELAEAYPVAFPNPDEDLTATAYMRWDRKYIYACIVANYNREMLLPPDNLHENKGQLNENKVDSIQFGFDVNPDETCSIVSGNRAANIWFAMSPNAWATVDDTPYQYMENLAVLFCSPNDTSPKATSMHLAPYHYDYWQRPNFATTLTPFADGKQTYTVEVRVARDLASKDFNFIFIANMTDSNRSGSRLIRSTSGMNPCMRDKFRLLTYADYTAPVVDADSGIAFKDISETLPEEGMTLSVTPVTSGAEYEKAAAKAGTSGKVLSVSELAFLATNGVDKLTETDEQVAVGLPLPENRDDEVDLIIYDTANDEQVDITYNEDEQMMYFYTNSLSTYALIDTNPSEPIDPDPIDPIDPDPVDPVDPDPSDPSDPGDPSDSGDPSDPGVSSEDSNTPDTGDSALPILCFAAVILSGAGMVSIRKARKSR